MDDNGVIAPVVEDSDLEERAVSRWSDQQAQPFLHRDAASRAPHCVLDVVVRDVMLTGFPLRAVLTVPVRPEEDAPKPAAAGATGSGS